MTNRRNGVGVAFLVAIPLTLPCATAPAQVPVDTPSLESAVASTLRDLHRQTQLPGMTAGLALADGTDVGVAVGVADRRDGVALKASDRLLMGSVGKTFVAAVALQLVKEQRIRLDEPIARWLGKEPWFDRLPHARRITVRHLMRHTSGLVRYELNPKFVADLSANPDKSWTPEERLAYLFDATAPFAPGEGWEYADTNYIVLGMIIERAAQASYYDELRRRILQPFRLDDVIPSDRPVVAGLVHGYAGPKNVFGGMDEMVRNGRYALNPQFEWTGGGLACTSRDLARWAKLLYEGRVVTEPALMEQMLDGVPARLGPETKYGLGVMIRQTGLGISYGHSGFMPGYQTDMMYFPSLEVAVAVQVNSSAPGAGGGGALSRHVVRLAQIVADEARRARAASKRMR